MKKFLLAGAASILAATAAFAVDDDNTFVFHTKQDDSRVISADGAEISIRDGVVYVDGQEIELEDDGIVIIEDGNVEIINHTGDHENVFVHRLDWTDHAEVMVEMGNSIGHAVFTEIDVDGISANVIATLEETLESLDEDTFVVRMDRDHDGRNWNDLTPEEQEEVRAELEEARAEIREAMAEVRIELAEVEREMAANNREIRVEVLRAHEEAAAAGRESARAEREVARAMRLAERELRRAERHAERAARREGRDAERRVLIERRHAEEGARFRAAEEGRRIRIVEDADGNRRVWVNGEEQTGDNLTDWLNRLEAERLDGGND
ncbi:hypothetical protein [Maricaulis sp.]|uniref:hypothetical protein n=1 Tax=Maricaulis sp. TaxID=1486257 RepID=UPI0026039212|nr:hypothetical protein [Maricaulis sp.]